MALTKVSGGILDPGISVAGIVTATGFDGPFIGGSSKNIVAGIITATELDISGNIDVDGHTELDQLNVSGVSTFVGNIGGTPTFTGDVTFNGNVSIAQTLTYSDVTNIDSVGIVTARQGVRVTADGNTSANYISVGASNDFKIYHTGQHTHLDNDTGHITVTANQINLNNQDNSENCLQCIGNAEVRLFHNGVKKLETNSSGIKVVGDIRVGNGSGLSIKDDSASETLATFNNNGAVELYHNNQKKLETKGYGIDITGGFITTGGSIVNDGGNIKFGTGSDLQIFHDNSNNINVIQCHNGRTLHIDKDNGAENMAKFIPDGAVELYHNNQKKIETFATGANVIGNLDVINGHVYINDNYKAYFGTGNDLFLEHDGNNSVFRNTTGDLYIQNNGSGTIFIQPVNNVDSIRAVANGRVELAFSGTKKLETTSSGVTVTGGLIADNVGVGDNEYIRAGNSSDIQFYHDANGSIHGTSAVSYIKCQGVHDNILDIFTASATGKINLKSNNLAETMLSASGNGAVELYHNNSKKFETTSTGASIAGDLSITGNIGSTSAEIGHVYLASSKYLYFGDNQNLEISHTNAGGGASYIKNKTGNLTFLTTDTGEFAAQFRQHSSVDLYYDHSKKFATSGIGVTVFGEVKASQEYPLIDPVLDFNFAAEKKLDPRIQFTRDSVATFVDKKGIIRYVSNNQPRFDHHPTSGASLGLLLERQRTNYQPYSVDMDAGAPNKNEVTVENNAAIAPDGTMSASKITGGTNQNTSQRLGWSTQGVASNSYTMWSIWVKSEETSCIVQIYSNTYTFGADHLNIELADGTTGGHSGEFGDTTFRYNIEKYPNKWWRLSWGGNGNAGGNSGGMYVAIVPSISSARGANTGSAHSKVWYAWGVQEEVGTQVKFASSYIPTNGAAVTRAADRGTIDGDDFDDFFDRYQGAVVHEISNAILSWTGGGLGWEFNNDNYQYNVITNIGGGYSHNAYPGGYAVIHGENSDSGTNSMSQFSSSSATGNQGFNNGYYAGRYPSTSVVDYNRLYKTYTDGMSWDISGSTNTLIAATGGFSASGTNTNNISHRNISKFELGSDATDMDGSYQKFSGRIKRWIYYDKALTATQLENLTAQDPVTYL